MSKKKSQSDWMHLPLVGWVAIPALSRPALSRKVYWLLWVIVNTLGWATRIIVILVIAGLSQDLQRQGTYYFEREPLIQLLVFVIYATIVGTIIGALQQFVLRRLFGIEGNSWRLATILGFTLSTMFGYLAPIMAVFSGTYIGAYTRNPIVSNVSTCGYVFVLGVVQWLVLRRHFTRSGLWIVATAIALWSSLRVWEYLGEFLLRLPFVSVAADGFIYGVVTAIALAIISKQPETVANLEK